MGSSDDAANQPQFGDQQTYWNGLKKQAEDGTFSLDVSLAGDLKKHCETMLGHLSDDLLRRAGRLSYLDGFGTLPSSTALKGAFESKAKGAPDALDTQYKKAIDIVTTMRDTYNIVITKLTGTDQDHATAISKQIGKL